MDITYGRFAQIGQKTGLTITTTETDLVVVSDPLFLEKSQIAVYVDVVLGSATKASFGLYFTPDYGVNWYKVPVEDLTTNKGELVDIPPYVDSASPSQVIATITHYKTVIYVPVVGATGFKVTGLSAGASTANTCAVNLTSRNN